MISCRLESSINNCEKKKLDLLRPRRREILPGATPALCIPPITQLYILYSSKYSYYNKWSLKAPEEEEEQAAISNIYINVDSDLMAYSATFEASVVFQNVTFSMFPISVGKTYSFYITLFICKAIQLKFCVWFRVKKTLFQSPPFQFDYLSFFYITFTQKHCRTSKN